jgi:hypothetical protein
VEARAVAPSVAAAAIATREFLKAFMFISPRVMSNRGGATNEKTIAHARTPENRANLPSLGRGPSPLESYAIT